MSVSNKPTSFSIAKHFPITIPLVCRRVERSNAAAWGKGADSRVMIVAGRPATVGEPFVHMAPGLL